MCYLLIADLTDNDNFVGFDPAFSNFFSFIFGLSLGGRRLCFLRFSGIDSQGFMQLFRRKIHEESFQRFGSGARDSRSLSVRVSLSPFVGLSMRPTDHPSVHLSIFPSVCEFIRLYDDFHVVFLFMQFFIKPFRRISRA